MHTFLSVTFGFDATSSGDSQAHFFGNTCFVDDEPDSVSDWKLVNAKRYISLSPQKHRVIRHMFGICSETTFMILRVAVVDSTANIKPSKLQNALYNELDNKIR